MAHITDFDSATTAELQRETDGPALRVGNTKGVGIETTSLRIGNAVLVYEPGIDAVVVKYADGTVGVLKPQPKPVEKK